MVGQWIEDTSQFNADFIKNYNGESDEGYFLEADVQYPDKLHELLNDLPFLPERMKVEKVEKLVGSLLDKTENVIKLNHELLLEKVHRATRFNQNAWLKNILISILI